MPANVSKPIPRPVVRLYLHTVVNGLRSEKVMIVPEKRTA
jgi:hypothetical protein